MAGSDVTFANTWIMYGKVVKIVNEWQKFGASNTPNLLDMIDALVVLLDGEFTTDVMGDIRALRGSLAGGITPDFLRRLWRPFARELCRIIGAPELQANGQIADATALKRIRQYMEDNTQTLNSRGMTLDTSASGSPTGTGAISRLTVDKDANTLECTGAEGKAFYCDKDQNGGVSKHAEVFEFRFDDADPSGLQFTGTGGTKSLASLHAKSGNILVNPSFEQGAVTNNTALATTGQLTGWDVGTAASWKTQSAAGYVYRGYANDTGVTHFGLECITSDTITQVVKAENPGAQFNERVPYYCQIAWQRKASATGNLTLHLGAQNTLVTIGSGTNDVWNILRIDLDSSLYYDNFKEDALDVKVQIGSLATGTVVIDDLVLAPMTNLDGTWWAVVGGATPWIRGDTLTYTDVDGTRALFSYWLWQTFRDQPEVLLEMRGWFPTDAAAGETIADPA